MKILDCFPYFNERELLELRIKLLYDVVDRFIICEANRTHEGVLKPFTAKKILQELGLFTDKVTVLEITLPSKQEVSDNWVRENLQRDALVWEVQDYDSVCIVTDLDEIMDPTFVKYYAWVATSNKKNILRIPMHFLNAKGDLHVMTPDGKKASWASGFIAMKHHFDCYSPSKIRASYAWRKNDIKFTDIFQLDYGVNLKAGWHMTWMGGRSKMIEKWQSFADQNDQLPTAAGGGSKEAVQQFMLHYNPAIGSTDPLGRTDHRLGKFYVQDLPAQLFQSERIKNYLFPREYRREHFYDNDAAFGENWFTFSKLYSEMVQRFPSGSKFVEVGVWKGRSLAHLLVEVINSGKAIECYGVDTWENQGIYDLFTHNLISVKDRYVAMRMESRAAAERFDDKSLDFVFIDTVSDYEAVKANILEWLPKIKSGGVLAGHDCYPDNPQFGEVYKAACDIFGKEKFSISENCFIFEVV